MELDDTVIQRVLTDEEHAAFLADEPIVGALEKENKTHFYADIPVSVHAPDGTHLFTLHGISGIEASIAECRASMIRDHEQWIDEGHIPADTPAPDFSDNDDPEESFADDDEETPTELPTKKRKKARRRH